MQKKTESGRRLFRSRSLYVERLEDRQLLSGIDVLGNAGGILPPSENREAPSAVGWASDQPKTDLPSTPEVLRPQSASGQDVSARSDTTQDPTDTAQGKAESQETYPESNPPSDAQAMLDNPAPPNEGTLPKGDTSASSPYRPDSGKGGSQQVAAGAMESYASPMDYKTTPYPEAADRYSQSSAQGTDGITPNSAVQLLLAAQLAHNAEVNQELRSQTTQASDHPAGQTASAAAQPEGRQPAPQQSAPSATATTPDTHITVNHPWRESVFREQWLPVQLPRAAEIETGANAKVEDDTEAASLSPGNEAVNPPPQVGNLAAGSLPFDLATLERGAEKFFAQIETLRETLAGSQAAMRLVPWLVAGTLATAAFEFARSRMQPHRGYETALGDAWRDPRRAWFSGLTILPPQEEP
jgi:hypothetical protein